VDNLSDYTLEYTAALLMNLSLRTMGKQACEDPSLETLTILSDLLENDNHQASQMPNPPPCLVACSSIPPTPAMQVRTYVNGTLYSILTRPALREKAQEIGLKDLLEELEPRCEEQFARQIRYIIQQLSSDAMDGTASDDEEGDDDEDDDSEDELEEEEEETVEAGTGMLAGEELLCGQFLANEAQARAELDATRPAYQQDPGVTQPVHQQAPAKLPRAEPEGLRATMPRPTTPSSRPGSRDAAMSGSFPSRQTIARTPFTNDGRQRQPSPSKQVKGVMSPVVEEHSMSPGGAGASKSPGGAKSPSAAAANSPGSPGSPSIEPKLRGAPPSEEKIAKIKADGKAEQVTVEEFQEAFASRPKMPRTP